MNISKVMALGSGIVYISCLCSCGGVVHNGIEICDKRTGKVVGTVESGEYREMACRDVRLRGGFFTITQENKSLMFRQRDQNGTIDKQYQLPLLNPVWVDSYWYSVSPKGQRLAYWKDSTSIKAPGWERASWPEREKMWIKVPAELRIRSFKDNSETVIFKKPTMAGGSDDFLAWSSSDYIIYVRRVSNAEQSYTLVFKIHTTGGVQKIKLPYRCRGIRMNSIGSLLAGVEDESSKQEPDWNKGDSVVIFDLHRMTLLKNINTGIEKSFVNSVAWNEKGNKLAFDVGVRGRKSDARYFVHNLDSNITEQDDKSTGLQSVKRELFDYLGLVWITGSGRYVKSY